MKFILLTFALMIPSLAFATEAGMHDVVFAGTTHPAFPITGATVVRELSAEGAYDRALLKFGVPSFEVTSQDSLITCEGRTARGLPAGTQLNLTVYVVAHPDGSSVSIMFADPTKKDRSAELKIKCQVNSLPANAQFTHDC
ncbi:MAG: hypothetical protein J0L82_16700 [Deltaproteobacteria bacterium]|jgi:hypothetical protein|nr:hypothetical protein [Deltaproteobacteria bacterium]